MQKENKAQATEKLRVKMQQIKSLVDECLTILESGTSAIKVPKSNFLKKKINESVLDSDHKKSLTEHIIDLRENKFLKQAQTAKEVHEKLKLTYSCELNRVAVGLVRLAEKKELRKAKKEIAGKIYDAYVW